MSVLGQMQLYPRKRTWISRAVMSALCQKRTLPIQLNAGSRCRGKSWEPHGFENGLRERTFAIGQPKHDIVMVRAGHGMSALCQKQTLPLVLRGLGKDNRRGAIPQVPKAHKQTNLAK